MPACKKRPRTRGRGLHAAYDPGVANRAARPWGADQVRSGRIMHAVCGVLSGQYETAG